MAERLIDVLRHRVGKDERAAKQHDWFNAAILTLRDDIIDSWMESTRRTYAESGKRVYYLSLEFLIGRLMRDALSNMGLTREMAQALREHGLDLADARRSGARCGAGQRRPRTAGRLLHGEPRLPRHPRLRLRHPLRERHVPPADRRRLAGRASRDLARPRQSVGIRPPRERIPRRLRRRGGREGRKRRLEAGRRGRGFRGRHAGRRLARQAGEHAAAVDRERARPDPARCLQRRRPRRRAGRARCAPRASSACSIPRTRRPPGRSCGFGRSISSPRPRSRTSSAATSSMSATFAPCRTRRRSSSTTRIRQSRWRS